MASIDLSLDKLFLDLPSELRSRLVETFCKIEERLSTGHFDASELSGAKFCETVFRVLEWLTNPDKSYTPFGDHLQNFSTKCKTFEQKAAFPDSVRFHIPSLLMSIFGIRNKRGVGHVEGEISPNHIDAVLVERVASWIMAELIRLLHKVDIKTASSTVQKLCDFPAPLIWEINGKQRVLDPSLSFKDRMLLLLTKAFPDAVHEDDLHRWLEHSNKSVFRRDVIRPAHREKLIEYDDANRTLHISPVGRRCVEQKLFSANA